MFKSGKSILVDQDMSFAKPPRPCIRKPHQFHMYDKNIRPLEGENLEKQTLIKSVGTNFMLFEGFIAAEDELGCYFTPYSTK